MRGATWSSGGTASPAAYCGSKSVVVVALNLLRRDLDALPESLLDEAQNLKPVAEDRLRRAPA